MKKSKLGDSDLSVSEIALGCMSLTGGASKSNLQVIQRAYDAGINYFDTADLYEKGLNEIMLGTAVQSFRKEVVLATKVGNKWRDDGSGHDWKASKKYILKEIDGSLLRLKTDYIDLYQLHGGMIEDPIDEIIEAFEYLVKAGKIRYYGLSSIRPNVFLRYAQDSSICSNMMQYSLLDRRPEEFLDQLKADGIGVVARGSIAQGLLIDKPAKEYLQYTSGEVHAVQKIVHMYAEKKSLSPLSVALSYVLSHDAVTSAVIGIRSNAQLDELLLAVRELKTLSASELQLLTAGIREVKYTDHR